jgi:hypothetical protein
MRGRDLDANLRRLERALASASPALRARILRLVRREIASLRRGDVTARDRRTIRRLERVEALLSPGAAGAQGEGDLASATPLAAAGAAPDPGSGGAATGTASSVAPAPARREPTPEPPSARPLLGVPFPGEIAFGALVLILFLAFLGVAALAFALAATPSAAVPAGRARRLLTTSRSNLAVTGLLALAATMLVLVVGVLL